MDRIKLKPEERERLVKLFQSDDCPGPPVYARIGMILNLDAGRSPDEVAKLFFAEPGELEEAVRIYREGGVEGLVSST